MSFIKACKDKKKYLSKEHAEDGIENLLYALRRKGKARNGIGRMDPYICHYCKCWHFGHSPYQRNNKMTVESKWKQSGLLEGALRPAAVADVLEATAKQLLKAEREMRGRDRMTVDDYAKSYWSSVKKEDYSQEEHVSRMLLHAEQIRKQEDEETKDLKTCGWMIFPAVRRIFGDKDFEYSPAENVEEHVFKYEEGNMQEFSNADREVEICATFSAQVSEGLKNKFDKNFKLTKLELRNMKPKSFELVLGF